MYQRQTKKLQTTPDYLDSGDKPNWNMDAHTPKDLLMHNVHLAPSEKVFEYSTAVKAPKNEKKVTVFSGVLEKGRCCALDHKTGEQCQNHPIRGIEYCWIYMQTISIWKSGTPCRKSTIKIIGSVHCDESILT